MRLPECFYRPCLTILSALSPRDRQAIEPERAVDRVRHQHTVGILFAIDKVGPIVVEQVAAELEADEVDETPELAAELDDDDEDDDLEDEDDS